MYWGRSMESVPKAWVFGALFLLPSPICRGSQGELETDPALPSLLCPSSSPYPSHPHLFRNGPPVAKLENAPALEAGGELSRLRVRGPSGGPIPLWLAIVEPLAYRITDRLRYAITIVHLPSVVSVLEFGHVAVQVPIRNRMVRAVQPTLKQREEAFH